MGLFAVSRLASRHGIRVRLRAASPQGLSVLIWLPGNLIGRESTKYGDRRSRELADESTVAHLRVGGRHSSSRQSLRAAEDDHAGNGNPRRESAGNAAAWFRAKRPSDATAQPSDATAQGAAAPATSSWVGGDWQPAESASAPARDNLTASGLPTRVPRSNLFPGSMAGRAAPDDSPTEAFPAPPPTPRPRYDARQSSPRQPASLPRRSPEHARDRMRGFQLGGRDAEDQRPLAGEESSR